MLKSIFYHLDYNYRPWNHTKSVPIMGVAGFTAGRELHPALKTNLLIYLILNHYNPPGSVFQINTTCVGPAPHRP